MSNKERQRSQLKFKFIDHDILKFHEIDYYRVITNYKIIDKFYKTYNEMCIKMLTEAMIWKNAYGVHLRTDDYFPRELWQIVYNLAGYDKYGRLILWNTASQYIINVNHNFLWLANQFIVHVSEKIDNIYQNERIVLINKFINNGLFLNPLYLRHFIKIYKYYPKLFNTFIFVDLHLSYRIAILLLIQNFSYHDSNSLKFIDKGKLKSFIDISKIPKQLGGSGHIFIDNYKRFKLFKDIADNLGMTKENVKQFYRCINLDI